MRPSLYEQFIAIANFYFQLETIEGNLDALISVK